MKKMYAICGMYFIGQEFKGGDISYGKQMFLGVEGEHRIYVYDNELTERSLIFETKAEAEIYMEEHKLNRKTMCTDGHFVLTIMVYQ